MPKESKPGSENFEKLESEFKKTIWEGELQEMIMAQARNATKAERKDGKCSQCGETAPEGNFCIRCGATFLTEEEIKEGKVFKGKTFKE